MGVLLKMDKLEIICTLPEMREAAESLNDEVLAQKSKSAYLKPSKLNIWCVSKRAAEISENVFQ